MLNSYKNNSFVSFFLKTYISLLLFFFDRGKKIVTNFPSTRLVDENIKANTGQKSWAWEVREKEKGLTQLLSLAFWWERLLSRNLKQMISNGKNLTRGALKINL